MTIGLGIVGLGWPGEQHAIAAQALAVEGVRLAAACDTHVERVAKFAARFSPAKTYGDYEAMLADPDVNCVVVALPNFLHYSATLAALRAGKHVLCEKPPTMNVAEIEAIRDEVYQRGLVYFFGRQSRFSDKMLTARRLIEEGRLGKVYYVKAEWIRARGIPAGIGGWFLDKARSGGGVMIDLGVHAIDAAWYALGCPAPVSVSGHVTSNFRSTLPAGLACDVEDGGYAFLRFAGGVALNLEVTWADNVTDAIPEGGWTAHELVNTTFHGDLATLRLEPFTLFSYEGKTRKAVVPELTGLPGDQFVRQLRSFVESVVDGTPPVSGVDQAASLMRMLTAVYESSAAGAEVRLA